MERLGVCAKCGKHTMVSDHHYRGYSEEHKDDTVPYCHSCDLKAHSKARKEGRCKLTHEQAHKQSINSYNRRSRKIVQFRTTIDTNVQLYENIKINKNTGTLTMSFGFLANSRKELFYLKE